MEDDLKKNEKIKEDLKKWKMADEIKKNGRQPFKKWKTTSQKNGRRPQKI